jgi:hypothetical protein
MALSKKTKIGLGVAAGLGAAGLVGAFIHKVNKVKNLLKRGVPIAGMKKQRRKRKRK